MLVIYQDLYTEISGQNGKELYAVSKPNPGEFIRFALGFANAGQIGGNCCEQNVSSRINTEALVCLNLDVMMCRIKLVKR
jgi:hypothetical protein